MTASIQKYLIFSLQGQRYAFDLAQVAQVEELPTIWPIPAAPACYAGAINAHGTITAVMDLAAFLGLAHNPAAEKVVILDRRIASLAFLVERVIRITPLEQSTLAPPPDETFALAQLNLPEGAATLLDAAAIADKATETING